MRIVEERSPRPRLLNSIEADSDEVDAPGGESPVALPRPGIFSGNSRWIFIGIVAGALAISVGGYVFSHLQQAGYPPRKLLSVITHSVSSSLHSTATPEPVTVQIPPEAVQVAAISLGHPRLAVINGSSVAEGDSLVIHTPGSGVVVRLRIVSIADGRVDLRNGQQLISARLRLAEPAQQHPGEP